MSEKENLAVVLQAYNAFKSGDMQTLLGSMSADVDWDFPEVENLPFSGRHQGQEGVTRFFENVNGSQEALSFEPREFIAQGDKVISLGDYKWRVKSNNREFGCDFCHVFTVRDGKIVAFKEFTDTALASAAHQKSQAA